VLQNRVLHWPIGGDRCGGQNSKVNFSKPMHMHMGQKIKPPPSIRPRSKHESKLVFIKYLEVQTFP
jgi:hypothetical protein